MPEQIPGLIPLSERELAALDLLDKAITAIYGLPAVHENDFFGVVMPACAAIQQVVMTAARRPGAPA